MDTVARPDRPTKRRRTKNKAIREGDEATAEGFLITKTVRDTDDGPIEDVTRHPIWKKTTESEEKSTPDPPFTQDANELEYNGLPDDPQYNDLVDRERVQAQKTQHYYLQEFVNRIHPLMHALLSREALPNRSTCSRCANGQCARWRCKDCTSARLMCRRCMRETHMDDPLHRIEVWTDGYFRSAELWETGVYILIRHHSGDPVCPVLDVHQRLLDTFQEQHDMQEQERLRSAIERDGSGRWWSRAPMADDMDGNFGEMEETLPNHSYADESEEDIRVARQLDHLYRIQAEGTPTNFTMADDMMEEDEVHVDDGNDIREGGPAYMPLGRGSPPGSESPNRVGDELSNGWSDELPPGLPTTMEHDHPPTLPHNLPTATLPPNLPPDIAGQGASAGSEEMGYTPMAPRADSLNNTYVRVVHVNGIHHMALVVCTCRGQENAHCDLMAERLVPTSFTRYRTVFTHAVLDDFRIANLECKASAYQYFQKLRRLTAPMAPDSVPNLYPELRRMSRLWRWMKKLKWAGFAYRDVPTTEATGGELANFCPACPQPGINLPDDWAEDEQK